MVTDRYREDVKTQGKDGRLKASLRLPRSKIAKDRFPLGATQTVVLCTITALRKQHYGRVFLFVLFKLRSRKIVDPEYSGVKQPPASLEGEGSSTAITRQL